MATVREDVCNQETIFELEGGYCLRLISFNKSQPIVAELPSQSEVGHNLSFDLNNFSGTIYVEKRTICAEFNSMSPIGAEIERSSGQIHASDFNVAEEYGEFSTSITQALHSEADIKSSFQVNATHQSKIDINGIEAVGVHINSSSTNRPTPPIIVPQGRSLVDEMWGESRRENNPTHQRHTAFVQRDVGVDVSESSDALVSCTMEISFDESSTASSIAGEIIPATQQSNIAGSKTETFNKANAIVFVNDDAADDCDMVATRSSAINSNSTKEASDESWRVTQRMLSSDTSPVEEKGVQKQREQSENFETDETYKKTGAIQVQSSRGVTDVFASESSTGLNKSLAAQNPLAYATSILSQESVLRQPQVVTDRNDESSEESQFTRAAATTSVVDETNGCLSAKKSSPTIQADLAPASSRTNANGAGEQHQRIKTSRNSEDHENTQETSIERDVAPNSRPFSQETDQNFEQRRVDESSPVAMDFLAYATSMVKDKSGDKQHQQQMNDINDEVSEKSSSGYVERDGAALGVPESESPPTEASSGSSSDEKRTSSIETRVDESLSARNFLAYATTLMKSKCLDRQQQQPRNEAEEDSFQEKCAVSAESDGAAIDDTTSRSFSTSVLEVQMSRGASRHSGILKQKIFDQSKGDMSGIAGPEVILARNEAEKSKRTGSFQTLPQSPSSRGSRRLKDSIRSSLDAFGTRKNKHWNMVRDKLLLTTKESSASSPTPLKQNTEDSDFPITGMQAFGRPRSTIPSYIRDKRFRERSYFRPSNVGEGEWFDNSGNHLNRRSLSEAFLSLNEDIRERLEGLSQSDLIKAVGPPTKLHALCAAPSLALDEVETALKAEPEATSVLDFRNRTPLHVLAGNDRLFLSPEGRFGVSAVCAKLIQIYPEAFTLIDGTGRMPFVSLLEDWCIWVYDHEDQERSKKVDSPTAFSPENKSIQRRQSLANTIATPVTRAAAQVSRGATYTAGHLTKGANRVFELVNGAISNNGEDTIGYVSQGKSATLYPRVQVWDVVEFSLEVISSVFDELGGKNGGLRQIEDDAEAAVEYISQGGSDSSDTTVLPGARRANNPDKESRSSFANHVIRVMPLLLKTVLLIDENATRNKILDVPLFQRLRVSPDAMGPWLTNMLRRKGIPAKRAVDYLLVISKSDEDDYVGGFRSVSDFDRQEFFLLKSETFSRLEKLRTTIASLVVLENKDVERAASCSAVLHIMNRNLARPFVVGLMLMDFVLHVTLMLVVRTEVGLVGTVDSPVTDRVSKGFLTQVALFICSFFVIRKANEAISLLMLSSAVFRAYLLNMWTQLDFMAIIMTLCAVAWNKKNEGEYRNGFNSLVVGLLWLKVLGFLKVVNRHMSIFIMAVTKILQDLKYFAIVLFVVIFMVGDMMRISVSTKDNGRFCTEHELDTTAQDFCVNSPVDAYLRIYALLLGDFELDNFRQTDGMAFLFFLFTILGVVILLNVLIAVIDDSYERAKIRGGDLFGRARVNFVAQNEALEAFLRPSGTYSKEKLDVNRRRIARATIFGRWLVLVTLIATALQSEMYHASKIIDTILEGGDYLDFAISSVLLVGLSAGLTIMIVFAFEKIVDGFAPSPIRGLFSLLRGFSNRLVRIGGKIIFGVWETSIDGVLQMDSRNTQEDEWNGRVVYMERMVAHALEQTKEDIGVQLEELERRMSEKQMFLEGGRRPAN